MDKGIWNFGGLILIGKNRSTRWKTCPSATWSTTESKWKAWDWTRDFAVTGWQLTALEIALPSTTCENIFGWHFFSVPSNLQDLFRSFGKLICIYSRNSFLIVFVQLHSECCAKLPCPATESHINFSAATTIYFLCFPFNSPVLLTAQGSGHSLKLQNSRIVCVLFFRDQANVR